MPEFLEWVVSHLPSESVVVTASDRTVICCSPSADELIRIIGVEAIVDAATHIPENSQNYLKVFPLINQTAEEKYLGYNEIFLKFNMKPVANLPMLRLISIEKTPEYQDMLEDLEMIKYIAESLPKGIALHYMKRNKSEQRFVYTSERFGTLLGRKITNGGIPGNCQIHPADLSRSEHLIDCMASITDCSVSIRIYVDGKYQRRRFVTRSNEADHELVMTSMSVEELIDDEGSSLLPSTPTSFRLNSFLSSSFEISFYVDTKFRIIGDPIELQSFFGTSGNENIPLTNFIQSDSDRKRFQNFMHELLQQCCAPAIPMLRLQLVSVGNVQLFACSTTHNKDCGEVFLVAIRRDTDPPVNVSKAAPTRLPPVPEEDDDAQSVESNAMSVDNNEATRLAAPKRIMVDSALRRFLSRDLFQSLRNLDHDDSEEWIVPYYDISDWVVTEEELVRALPTALQADFMHASRQGMYSACSKILAFTVDGNVGILSKDVKLSGNVDLIRCSYRFFLGMVHRLQDEDAYKLLTLLDKSKSVISSKLGRSGSEIATLVFTSIILSVAIRRHQAFDTPSSLNWLRTCFAYAMKLPGTKVVHKTHRVRTMYHICILWACLMYRSHREDEARVLLENIEKDMDQFCTLHTESISVRQLHAIAIHNIALIHMNRNDLDNTRKYIDKLCRVLNASNYAFPEKCRKLVQCATDIQNNMSCV